jgi:hypothetical protein
LACARKGLPVSLKSFFKRLSMLCSVLLLISSERLEGAVVARSEITLDAFIKTTYPSGRRPVVHSFAKVTLVDENGFRVYDAQVILGHRVFESNVSQIFNAQVITYIGLANSTTGDMPANSGSCYQADMQGHVNAYNLHPYFSSTEKCIYEPAIDVPEENCPVLLDIERDGFHLSGADRAVSFDINADGFPDTISWTQIGEDEAFLCLDRNHNGSIDDGSELFGYATQLRTGRLARVSYRALAELDDSRSGGNGDGRIDAQDGQFSELCAWVDGNHDGISQAAEIRSLPEVGVEYLEYGYRPLRLYDSFGNLFRYVSRVGVRDASGEIVSWPTYDVIFTEP